MGLKLLCVGCYAGCIDMPPSPNLSELIATKPLPVTAVAGCLTFQEPGIPTTVQGLLLGAFSMCPPSGGHPCHTSRASGLCLDLPFRPGDFHGLYRPWGRKESDTTERLSPSLSNLSYLICLFEVPRSTQGLIRVCWPRQVQSSIRVAKESWGLLSSDCTANRPHLGLCPEA